METVSCKINVDPIFQDIPPRIQQIIMGTIEDLAPKLGIPSVLLVRDDLKGIGDAYIPEDGTICYDNNYLLTMAHSYRIPVRGAIKKSDLENATAHELYHLSKFPFKGKPYNAMSLDELLKNQAYHNREYCINEEEFEAAMYAFKYIRSKPAMTIVDAIGKTIFQLKEGKRLAIWRRDRLELKYGKSLNQLSNEFEN